MEKKKWPWKRKSSERSSGESDSSGSASSHSERDSDEQPESSKESPSQDVQSPEVSSKADTNNEEEVNESIRTLTEKLSAALVNVSAKDDLVKQHAKVAEEAVAGWEKAENEVAELKQKLEAATKQNSLLEDRVSHLDGALKECVRQLRQSREEQEQKIHEAVAKKTQELESAKTELDNQLQELQNQFEAAKSEPPACPHPDITQTLESLGRENAALKLELLSQSEELELRTLERELSTHAAETASKQHLESIKKAAKLEAECRRLRALTSKPSNDNRSIVASSMYVDSLTDSQSDSGECLNALDIDAGKGNVSEQNKSEDRCSDLWASALIAELDQCKNVKAVNKILPTPSIEIDLMDDFLEMERLVSLPETKNENQQDESEPRSRDAESSLKAEIATLMQKIVELEEKLEKMEAEKSELEAEIEQSNDNRQDESEIVSNDQSSDVANSLRAEIETLTRNTMELELKLEKLESEKSELDAEIKQSNEIESSLKFELEVVTRHKVESEERLEKTEAEKAELETALNESRGNYEQSQICLTEIETKLEELQKELDTANETKQRVESQIISMEADARTTSSMIESLEADVLKERALSAQLKQKCCELEEELLKKELELQQNIGTNCEPRIKQEDLAVAAGKLADCQKTIASLGKQLESLATLEDFLIDTASIPGLAVSGSSNLGANGAKWKLHSNGTYSPRTSEAMRAAGENGGSSLKTNEVNSQSLALASPPVLPSNGSSEKNRNGFAKFFTRSKNGIQLEI